MTKEKLKSYLIFYLNESTLTVENRKGHNTKTRKKIPWLLKKNTFTNDLVPTIFSMSLQFFDMDKKLKLFQKIDRAEYYFPEEIPLWILEYEEIWEFLKDNIYESSVFGRSKVTEKDLIKKGIKPGSKKVNIDGFINGVDIILDLNNQELTSFLSKGFKTDQKLPVNTVVYYYKKLKYRCSYGPHGMHNKGFIVSYPYKQLLKPDTATSKRIMSYFEQNPRYKDGIINPQSITTSHLIDMLKLNSLVSKDLRIRVMGNSGKEVRLVDFEELIKEQGNDSLLIKILDIYKSGRNVFNLHDIIMVFDKDQVKKFKDDIVGYLIKEDLQEFIDNLSKLNPSFQINKSLIDSLTKKGFEGVLQEHQKIGVSWYWGLYKKGAPGAILADEMGMGKSVQTIAFLTAADAAKKKTLIVCPASVISVWENELKKFNPTLAKKIGSNIEIMSYEKAARSGIKKVNFLILDEAQKIKNKNTLAFKAIAAIEKEFVCIVSGTPIENSVSDLFSLLQILNESAYDLLYILNRVYPDQHDLIATVRELIDPIYLQRKKSKEQLSASITINEVKISPSSFDLKLQSEIKRVFRDKLIKEKANNNHDFYSMVALTGLMRLRQAVSNPKQLPDELKNHFDDKLIRDINNLQPTKIKELKSLCSKIKNRNEKVVIFAMFGETINLIREELSKSGHKVLSFTGSDSSTKRKILIDEFQKPDSNFDVFVISLKAGNTGITLTNANNVIIYDLWYNPAVIAQAIARVHRIGQQKDVNAYIMIVDKTIDSAINNIFLGKQELISKFSNKGSSKDVSKNALTELSKKLFKE